MKTIQIQQVDIDDLQRVIKDAIVDGLRGIDNNQEAILSFLETKNLLQITDQTLYKYVRENTIPYHKNLNRLYFLKSELVEWIKAKGAQHNG